jgi:hypothetical protein
MCPRATQRQSSFTRSGRRQRTTQARNSQAVAKSLDPQLERIDALFVQGAARFSSTGDTVTLHGLVDSTVYFADRPRREIGHIPSHRFVELWTAGVHSFAADPPNAVISFLDEGGDTSDVVVVLHEAILEGDDLTYRIEVLEGTLPAESGPCTLFIDVFGRPLSPVSVAGSKRRPLRQLRRP